MYEAVVVYQVGFYALDRLSRSDVGPWPNACCGFCRHACARVHACRVGVASCTPLTRPRSLSTFELCAAVPAVRALRLETGTREQPFNLYSSSMLYIDETQNKKIKYYVRQPRTAAVRIQVTHKTYNTNKSQQSSLPRASHQAGSSSRSAAAAVAAEQAAVTTQQSKQQHNSYCVVGWSYSLYCHRLRAGFARTRFFVAGR